MGSYVLLAIAFSATQSSSPTPPTMTQMGEFDDALACTQAAATVARTIQNGVTQQLVPRNVPLQATMLLQCLPQQVPAQCALDPDGCELPLPPMTVFQAQP